MIITAITIVNIMVLVYFVALTTVYLSTSLTAFWKLRQYVGRLNSLDMSELVTAAEAIPVTLLVPAYNEMAGIVESVRSLLTLRYSRYEVIVISDGSTDDTLGTVINAFEMSPAARTPSSSIPTARIRGVFRSNRYENLWLISKENGGKADSLNAGINYTRSPLFCAMDADTLLEPDSLPRLVRPFLENDSTVAAGGIIRIVNGCDVEKGLVKTIRLPKSFLARVQVVEYLRAFLATRMGFDAMGATLIISGAFGVFRRSTVTDVGGYSIDTVGEDMELVVKLHRHCRDRKLPYRVYYVPDPVAWTEAPENLADLGGQRNRWQRGLVQTLWRHRQMFGKPRYGGAGLVGFTYYAVFEVLGPIIETIGYLSFILTLLLGIASPLHIIAFSGLAMLAGVAISLGAVGLEEMSFRRYADPMDLIRLIGIAVVENFGYRQLSAVWRIQGLIAAIRGDRSWGSLQRQGFASPAPKKSAAR